MYADLATALEPLTPNVVVRVAVGGPIDGFTPYEALVQHATGAKVRDDIPGLEMFYSSGTTGRPKGIRRPLIRLGPTHYHVFLWQHSTVSGINTDTVFLCPAPLYHAAPLMASLGVLTAGGTVVMMAKFDAELVLQLVERHRVTNAQFVPTMFVRMLRLPADVRTRYDLSSLTYVGHAAAPCPVPVKRVMFEWLGPIIHEYYNATEAIGGTKIGPEEWLAHPGSVGRVGPDAHILDDEFNDVQTGAPGTLWFDSTVQVTYHGDPDKAASQTSPQGYRTVGDMGYIDAEGYLFLTDRATFMIVSGGVNIYPQEIEAELSAHPSIADVAVFGVPNAEFGEEVKAVVQLTPGVTPSPELAAEIQGWCRDHFAHYKCPRSIDFIEEMPRDPSGKLYKKRLRDEYWPTDSGRRIG
jgi:long-chain acyl-CoA synthetase